MSAFYLDSSAIVKRYIFERGSGWIAQLFDVDSPHTLYTSSITRVEVVAAIAKRRRMRTIPPGVFEGGIARLQIEVRNLFAVIALEDAIIESAILLAKMHPLRGYDAVQLASALFMQPKLIEYQLTPLIFVSADSDLNNIATLKGLTVENPNDYPQ